MSAKCAIYETWQPVAVASPSAAGWWLETPDAGGRSPGATPRSAVSWLLSFVKSRIREPARHAEQDAAITELVAVSKAGDARATELLIRQYQARVAAFVFTFVDDDAVEDLCQTTFLKAITGLSRLKDNSQFEAWIFRIARNACLDYLRRRTVRQIFVPWEGRVALTHSFADPADESRIDAFRAAIIKLPRRQRELVALLQDGRMTYEQLAAITNSSVSSVRSRLFRARRQLRRSMRGEI